MSLCHSEPHVMCPTRRTCSAPVYHPRTPHSPTPAQHEAIRPLSVRRWPPHWPPQIEFWPRSVSKAHKSVTRPLGAGHQSHQSSTALTQIQGGGGGGRGGVQWVWRHNSPVDTPQHTLTITHTHSGTGTVSTEPGAATARFSSFAQDHA